MCNCIEDTKKQLKERIKEDRKLKSLLSRFKEVYEAGTDFKVSSSNLDKDGNLTVGISDDEGIEKFWLHVEDHNGEIIWY